MITGGDSGIGRAVALAYAREGANVLISYLARGGCEGDASGWWKTPDARPSCGGRYRMARALPAIIDRAVAELGGIDILVNNAARQATFKEIEDMSDEEWESPSGSTSMRCSI